MLLSRRGALVGAFGTIVTACLAGGEAADARSGTLTLAEIIARHTRARGGARRLDSVKAVLIYPTISEKGSTLPARYLCDDQPAWRIDIYAGGAHVFSEGMDAKGPWLWPSGDAAPHDAVADARKTGIEGIEFNLYGLHRFPARGHTLSLDGRELIDGTDYYVVRAVMKDAYETYLYINPKGWMIERRRDYRAFHPDVDPKKAYAEKIYSDFRTVDGIVTPFSEKQVNWKTGELVNSTVVSAMAYNPAIRPGELERHFHAAEQLSPA